MAFSTSFRDTFGSFNPYGDLYKSRKSQSLNLAIGAAARVTEHLETSVVVPWVRQIREDGIAPHSGLGDVTVGSRYQLLESLFQDEWYPNIYLLAGMKFPTGSTITKDIPGTGNGFWEPYFGSEFKKEWAPLTMSFSWQYTPKLNKVNTIKGDRIDLAEALSWSFSRRFSVGIGSTQIWELDGQGTRLASGFANATSFVTQFWSFSANFDSAFALARTGVNQEAVRSFTVTTRYGFY